ncbi:MAG: RNA polymerase sigma factor [Chloroflexota bacterium]|nr:RNA polymerase sigma factor [Chloroflexota bacterium]
MMNIQVIPGRSSARAATPSPPETVRPVAPPPLAPETTALPQAGSDEAALVAAARAGDRAAFGALFDRYQTPIVNYLYRVVGDWDTANDLAQDSFLKAYQALGRTDADLQIAPWLYRIATNTALDALRRRKRITWVPFLEEYEPPALGGDPGTTVPNQDAVHRALQAVPDDYRVALVLHLHQGLSYKEIGALLGVAPNLVAVRVFRGREKFIKAYNALTGESDA